MALFSKPPKILQEIGADFARRSQDIMGTINRGADALNQGSTPGKIDSFGTMLGKTGALLSTGLQTSGSVAGAALDPITSSVNAVAKPIADTVVNSPVGKAATDNKSVQKFAMKAGDTIDSIKNKSPETVRNIGAIGNITALLGMDAAIQNMSPRAVAAKDTPQYTPAETAKQIDNHFATAKQILEDPDMSGNVPTTQLLDRTKTNIVDDLTHGGAKDVAKEVQALDMSKYENIADFQSDVKTIMTNNAAEKFVAHPEQIPLFRGEKIGNQGGMHFTPDESWSKNFGGTSLQGSLPAGSKVFTINNESMQEALKQGLTNDDQFYKSIFDKGYDAILGTDARNTHVLDVVVNPKNLDNFKVSPIASTPPGAKFLSSDAQKDFYKQLPRIPGQDWIGDTDIDVDAIRSRMK